MECEVIELEGCPSCVDPVLIAAFEGWNDAGEAASGAVEHLAQRLEGRPPVAALDPEDYYDFQVNRPDGRDRRRRQPADHLADHPAVAWPAPARDARRGAGARHRAEHALAGVLRRAARARPRPRRRDGRHARARCSPTRRTPGRCRSPARRPTPRWPRSSARAVDVRGPDRASSASCRTPARHAGIPAVSLWAAVPHYVAQPPSPKATLALLARHRGPAGHPDRRWASCPRRRGPGSAASTSSPPRTPRSPSTSATLEEREDAADLPEASGEAIAREFERYLRRRGTDAG